MKLHLYTAISAATFVDRRRRWDRQWQRERQQQWQQQRRHTAARMHPGRHARLHGERSRLLLRAGRQPGGRGLDPVVRLAADGRDDGRR